MRNRIKEFVDSKGMSVYQFWQETGISRTTAYNLYNNSAQYLARDVMNAICTRYRVQPDILLKWIPDEESKNGN
ncbi:helix-turn-helix domain-containing protein [Nostoc sp.]|uniref:helix-turn-helix domain-containing protein n=1 Tax=Nostoc sp. TaxID=1180 RepID=UPI002FF8AD76